MAKLSNNQVRHKFFEELEAPNHRKIELGDIFAYRIKGKFRFVRVIKPLRKIPDEYITYWYLPVTESLSNVPTLVRGEFLVNPTAIYADFFLRDGFFKKLCNRPLEVGDAYPRHCFENTMFTNRLDYEDEDGTQLAVPFEPMVILGRPPELQIGLALGLCKDYKEYMKLSDQPRPHYRAAVKSQLPHSRVSLTIKDFPQVAQEIYEKFGMGKKLEPLKDVREWAWPFIERQMGFSGVLKPIAYKESFSGAIIVKQHQHPAYYKRVEEVMAQLGINEWFISDGVLDDWLYGTYRPEGAYNPVDYRTPDYWLGR